MVFPDQFPEQRPGHCKNGYAMLLPGEFSLESWKSVLKNTDIFRAFGITLSRTLIVTVVQTLCTAMFAYGFSRDNLVGKKFYTVLGFISMYLNGGVIAYFILFNAMHIYNSYWVYILPALFGGFYNVIIFNTNFKAIPESLFESAKIDGASEYTIFFRLVIPLSKPVISALGIFTAWPPGTITPRPCTIPNPRKYRRCPITCFPSPRPAHPPHSWARP